MFHGKGAALYGKTSKGHSGFLIVFEGIDGSGKSTQAKCLFQDLRDKGYPVLLSQEPTYGPWGQRIREIILHGRGGVQPEEEYDLFLQDRKDHVRQVITPSLDGGKIVILDRYYFSTMAYQGALGIEPARIQKENESFAPLPDLVFILDLPPVEAIRRIENKRGERPNHFERIDYLDRVRTLFRSFSGPAIVHLDGHLSTEKLFDEIAGRLLNHAPRLETLRGGMAGH